MSENHKLYVISDGETGEKIGVTDTVITGEQLEEMNRKRKEGYTTYLARKEYYDKDRRKFVTNFMDSIEELSSQLSLVDAGYLMKLLPYTQEDGKLRDNGGGGRQS
ncbi:hypothetical protein CEH05_20580 (plasmid) [Halobacillus halophilus]|uniref:hypothetical protein n=1 Tax=Halobacillus halophilus TaxID=1570 RepID=UPI000B519671|nr:hypothetical protein [Halobacillus halophilus]ASF41587.1 hypothetical protein CEH05_20580 [Halobacillus halophilus]